MKTKIYVVRKHQGDYEEYRMENLCAFKTKEMAEHHVNRLKQSYMKLHEFYYDKVEEVRDEYGYDIMTYPDEVYNKWEVFNDKKRHYYGAEFDVQELDIRRFQR